MLAMKRYKMDLKGEINARNPIYIGLFQLDYKTLQFPFVFDLRYVSKK